jgi:hypothetical protein
MLIAPRVVGDRLYNDEVVAKDCFAPILDRTTHALVRAALSSRNVWQPPNSQYVLTGLLRCGACGARMFGRMRHGGPALRPSGPGLGGQSHS